MSWILKNHLTVLLVTLTTHLYTTLQNATWSWSSFSQWLSHMFNSFDTTLDESIIIFGIEQAQKEINVMNYILIMAKLFINKNKLAKKRSIDFYKVLSFLKETSHGQSHNTLSPIEDLFLICNF